MWIGIIFSLMCNCIMRTSNIYLNMFLIKHFNTWKMFFSDMIIWTDSQNRGATTHLFCHCLGRVRLCRTGESVVLRLLERDTCFDSVHNESHWAVGVLVLESGMENVQLGRFSSIKRHINSQVTHGACWRCAQVERRGMPGWFQHILLGLGNLPKQITSNSAGKTCPAPAFSRSRVEFPRVRIYCDWSRSCCPRFRFRILTLICASWLLFMNSWINIQMNPFQYQNWLKATAK